VCDVSVKPCLSSRGRPHPAKGKPARVGGEACDGSGDAAGEVGHAAPKSVPLRVHRVLDRLKATASSLPCPRAGTHPAGSSTRFSCRYRICSDTTSRDGQPTS
jgi:hypothetical protein